MVIQPSALAMLSSLLVLLFCSGKYAMCILKRLITVSTTFQPVAQDILIVFFYIVHTGLVKEIGKIIARVLSKEAIAPVERNQSSSFFCKISSID